MSVMRKYDLFLVWALCLLQVILVYADVTGVVRVASGFLFVVLLPGYSFLAAIYRPYRRGDTVLEHVALAVPVSLALGALLGLLLNQLGWSIRADRHVVWLSLLTCGLALAAMIRTRADAPPAFGVRAVAVCGAMLFLGLGLGAVAHGIAQPADAGYVSLYLLDGDGRITQYPVVAHVNQPVRVTLGVTYAGPAQRRFELVAPGGARTVLTLKPGRTWMRTVHVVLARPGLQRLAWRLSGRAPDTSVRSVHLWVRVR